VLRCGATHRGGGEVLDAAYDQRMETALIAGLLFGALIGPLLAEFAMWTCETQWFLPPYTRKGRQRQLERILSEIKATWSVPQYRDLYDD
jgi:hypothetical protein